MVSESFDTTLSNSLGQQYNSDWQNSNIVTETGM